MSTTRRLIPIYTTRGELGAYLSYPYIYNLQGEWIGWVSAERQVYSVHGHLVGELSAEPRILRKRDLPLLQVRQEPPERPPRIRPPAHVPLAPLMPELPQNMVDVLDEAPDLLPAVDFGDLRQDMD